MSEELPADSIERLRARNQSLPDPHNKLPLETNPRLQAAEIGDDGALTTDLDTGLTNFRGTALGKSHGRIVSPVSAGRRTKVFSPPANQGYVTKTSQASRSCT